MLIQCSVVPPVYVSYLMHFLISPNLNIFCIGVQQNLKAYLLSVYTPNRWSELKKRAKVPVRSWWW